MLRNKLLFEYDLEDIWFFSLTCKTDLMYKPLFKLYSQYELKPKIRNKIDFDEIESIIKEQEGVSLGQMISLSKNDEPSLKKILFIFDDIL